MTGTRVTVEVPGRPYPVLVGHGVLAHLPELVSDLGVTSAAVVADRAVAASCGTPLAAALASPRGPAPLLEVEAGEQAKTLAGVERVLAFLEAAGLDRHGLVVAVGGGTIGDLAGFAAAVWLRGVRCVHVPTTLLAMVDSSVGGKTGVNSPAAKNAIGAFWQPVAVVADLATLATLPEAHYLAAFAEVVKYGVAMDAGLAARLEAERGPLLARSRAALEPVVARCVELKAGVVAADEREGGPREILNYGHTVGHALECASGFTAVHGRAVALGMKAAARIAVQVGVCDPDLVGVQDRLLDAFGLPGGLPRVTADAVLGTVPRDKKVRERAVRWVLPTALGAARIGVEVPGEVVAAVLRGLVP